MRILVTGRDGQVARALALRAVAGLHVETRGRPDLDLCDPESLARAIAECRPDILVNAAAYTAVDRAESEKEAAFAVNRDGAANAARAAAEAGIPVIHLSTDYVFSGDKNAPYQESDPTDPQSVYGHSKLAGEKAVAEANPAHVILRTAWVYSETGKNFVLTMLRLAGEREELSIVADQRGNPTYAGDIAEAILKVADHVLGHPDKTGWRGVFHMSAAGEASWAEFAEAIFERSRAAGGPSAKVIPIATADYPTPARRPANSRLDNTAFEAAFHHALPDWRDGLQRCLDERAKDGAASAP